MFNVGPGEMFAIMLLALIVLGPERLPKAMGQVGRFVGQLRRMSGGFQDEIRRAMDPDDAPFRPGEERHAVPPSAVADEVKVVNAGDDGDQGDAGAGGDHDGGDDRTEGPPATDPSPGPEGGADDDGPDPDLRATG